MRDALIVSALSLVPRRRVARWMGVLARTGWSRRLTRAFVRAYDVDLSDAVVPAEGFSTLDALFTRRLRPGARPVDPDPLALVSPVDGVAAWVGTVSDGEVPIAPGRTLSVEALVGAARPGPRDVAVLYLSPRDYHRVHVPRAGRLRAWRYVPGTLWPVFPAAVRRVDGLFARNERLAVALDDAAGGLDVVLVGAFGVGRIEVDGVDVVANTGARAASGALDRAVAAGDDLGVFHLGSTVVLVAPGGSWRWDVVAGEPVRVGRRIATRRPAA